MPGPRESIPFRPEFDFFALTPLRFQSRSFNAGCKVWDAGPIRCAGQTDKGLVVAGDRLSQLVQSNTFDVEGGPVGTQSYTDVGIDGMHSFSNFIGEAV